MAKKSFHVGKTFGPYSPAVESTASKMLFVSGQIGVDPASGNLAGESFEAQAKQVLANLQAVLEAARYGVKDVVKVTVFLTDLANFVALNEMFQTFFVEPYPARATVQVNGLPKGALIEIDAVATREAERSALFPGG